MTNNHITHLITSLDTDGAQLAMARILGQVAPDGASVDVISLAPDGPVGDLLREAGIRVRSLEMRSALGAPWAARKLATWLRQERPSVLVTWLYHANVLGSLAAELAGRGPTGKVPVVWNVHHSHYDPQHGKLLTRLVIRLGARLAPRAPRQTVFCSARSRELHCQSGYPAERSVVIPNGFELDRFRPCRESRREVRRELRIPENAPVVGIAGRFHPDKDHATFAAAAGVIARRHPDACFVLCGRDITTENRTLVRWLQQAGAISRCRLLGPRSDVPRLLAALDVYASSSASEAFPLAIGEAMASGVPCVATDVGDCAHLVGDVGRLVPPREPLRLARACLDLLNLPLADRVGLGAAARQRIAEHFDLRNTAGQHLSIWRAVAEGAAPPASVPASSDRAVDRAA